MPVTSMTGFARWEEGGADDAVLLWEVRAVNGKGLDVRLRLPPGFEAIEAELKRLAAARVARGNLQATLQLRRSVERSALTINRRVLEEVIALSQELVAQGHAGLPTADGLLALRGVIEAGEEPVAEEAGLALLSASATDGFAAVLDRLNGARTDEGAAIGAVLSQRIDEIERLVHRAEADEARSPEAIRERLRTQLAQILEAGIAVDPQRLAQEAALIATKADIREELDRLVAHIAAARKLLRGDGAVGRRLDFLAQEFNRESNTLCSKSNAASLTAIGLELKVVVDQFREQVQNIE